MSYKMVAVNVYVESVTCGCCAREDLPEVVSAQQEPHFPRDGVPNDSLVATGTRLPDWSYGMDLGSDDRSIRLCPECAPVAALAVREALAKRKASR